LHLKRLLVGGLERVYEIGRCYRNEAIDSRHNPEFTYLELYEAYTSTNQIINFLHSILSDLIGKAENPTFSLEREPFIISIEKIVDSWCREEHDMSISLFHLALDKDGNLPKIPLPLNFRDMSVEMRNLFLFENFVKKYLADRYNHPIFVVGFPIESSPLAKPLTNNLKLADRFELYINGIEVANGFQELNDPDVQASNFRSQLEAKKIQTLNTWILMKTTSRR
jgi:lysyl-tRNA synthetase class 2